MLVRHRLLIAASALAAAAGGSLAANADLQWAPTGPAMAGNIVSVDLTTAFGGLVPPGVFGAPGLYMFFGDVSVSGPASVIGATINPLLNSAVAPGVFAAPDLLNVGASRGIQPAIVGSPRRLMSVDLLVDATANLGDVIRVRFDGDVVLDNNSALETFSSSPGVNQTRIAPAVTFITVVGGCNPADLSPVFGTLDINDILVFAGAFNQGLAIADLFPAGGDGVFDINDILAFANFFNQGCP